MDQSPCEPFRVLYVCTGNLCRSPFAQLHTRFLLDAWLGPHAASFAVASAGVGAVPGSAMHPSSREQLGTRRDHPAVERFRARQLSAPEVVDADLVLTMSRRQRSRVLGDVPSALPRTFTLRELARLVGAVDLDALPSDPVARARALMPAALAARGRCGPVPPEDDAVPDPIGGHCDTHSDTRADAHTDAARTIDAAVRRIFGVIVPPTPVPTPNPSPHIPGAPRVRAVSRPAAFPPPRSGPSAPPRRTPALQPALQPAVASRPGVPAPAPASPNLAARTASVPDVSAPTASVPVRAAFVPLPVPVPRSSAERTSSRRAPRVTVAMTTRPRPA